MTNTDDLAQRIAQARGICPEVFDALEDVLEEAENTSAMDDAKAGEDDMMLKAVNKARSILGDEPVEIESSDEEE
ncbi:hypothetical protein [Roseibium sp. Sym1]|uniref:hypothetical protein n=1 Tax=Roseibium sp. Sym1 TaxID=3016006 RepID=UPI0022B4C89C|nr:hypothetical protein [Roseibium sp. Sym1]